jgi:hypothetical protein
MGEATPRRRRALFWYGLLCGLLVGLGLGGLGTTLAANISLGSGPIEFGQGAIDAQACDPSIDISPRAGYTLGGDGNHYWILEFLDFKNVDVAKCSGKIFTVRFTAGIPGDPAPRPYTYSFPIDFIPNAGDDTHGQFWSGNTSLAQHAGMTKLIVEGIDATHQQADRGFGAEFFTPDVSSTSQTGTFTITTRVLAKDIGPILLETSDQ